MSRGSFSQGLGEWIGSAEVYDGNGRFAGMGRDTRTVRADDGAGRVTVDVTFEGPFSLAGTYTIADHGTHRTYEGPLNIGFAEVLGDGLVAAHNYWPSAGLSQRFFLMVLPGGNHQLSLALLSRGDQLCWTVVGEYRRQGLASASPPPLPEPLDPSAMSDDPAAGRDQLLLLRPGRWSGRLHCLGPDLSPSGSAEYTETVAPADRGPTVRPYEAPPTDEALAASQALEATDKPAANEALDASPRDGAPAANEELQATDETAADEQLAVKLSGLRFAPDASFTLVSDGWTARTPTGDVVGSAALSGGRALSGQFHHDGAGCRVWRREVASVDGSVKAVLHIWYRGEERLGALYGTLAFDPP